MIKTQENNVKLGLFVVVGLLLLIVSFYMIGNGGNIFKKDFEIKARFDNLNGLKEGNNVLFSGIQAGTVKSIDMVSDTIIEVILAINGNVQPFIQKNAEAAIGTEGLMGNKVINIQPVNEASEKISNGDMLQTRQLVNTDVMLKTLANTNDDVAAIAKVLKETVIRLDASELFNLMNDTVIVPSLKSSLDEINNATKNASAITQEVCLLVQNIRKGKGTAGTILTDTLVASNLKTAIEDFRISGEQIKMISKTFVSTADGLDYDLKYGQGPLGAILRDSLMTLKFEQSIDNIQRGTQGFDDLMDATKHSFLFRGYFKRLERKKNKMKKE